MRRPYFQHAHFILIVGVWVERLLAEALRQ